MARAAKAKPVGGLKPDNSLQIKQTADETGAQAMARKFLQPSLKNAAAASGFMGKMFGEGDERPGLHDYATHVQAVAKAAESGDIAMASQMLASQAVTLDAMFAELARRTALNLGDYINAAERYGRLALKAQSNCRATLEALARLHQPREQTVRHVHVNEGGQAVIADQIHNHPGGGKNAKSNEQCHATGAAGESAALPGRTRRGTACQSPAVRGKQRCRMHGGTNPGAPEGNRNAWKHGGRSDSAEAAARYLRMIAKVVADAEG